MLRCRLRFFQRLICLVILVGGSALLMLYRYHEMGVLKSNEFLRLVLNNEINEVTSKRPAGSPMVVYKRKVNQSAANNRVKTLSATSAWHVWRTWPQSNQLYDDEQFNSSEMRDILHHMATAPIVKFDVGHKGTQLKAQVELEGGQLAVFKPKRYALTHDLLY